MNQTWQERVGVEFTNLNNNIKKLTDYLKLGAPGANHFQASLMRAQLSAMQAYSDILSERLREVGRNGS